MSKEIENRVLDSKTCVARNRRGLDGKNCYAQIEGYLSVDYINNEPVAFSLCPSRGKPKGFDGTYISEKIDNFPKKLFKHFGGKLELMSRKSFLKKLSEARCIDSDRIRSNWKVIL